MFDSLKAAALKKFLNANYKKFGQVLDLDLDTGKRTVKALVTIEGEDGEWTVRASYKLTECDDGTWEARVKSASTNHKKYNALLKKHVVGESTEIPAAVAMLL